MRDGGVAGGSFARGGEFVTAPSLDRLAIHTWTTRPLTLAECIEVYAAAGVSGISPWREHVAPVGAERAGKMIRDAGLRVPALVRAGFFVDPDRSRRAAAVEDCRAAIADAAAIGAESVVIVPGAHADVASADGREMVAEALAAVVEDARGAGVRLGLEPLHPVFERTRSCVVSLAQAREIVGRVGHPALGIVVDVYHVWEDPGLETNIREIGREGQLLAFHVSDWKPEAADPRNDRGLMGEGCIDIRRIRSWMDAAGFDGMIEVEIFSDRYWAEDQREYVGKIKDAYLAHV